MSEEREPDPTGPREEGRPETGEGRPAETGEELPAETGEEGADAGGGREARADAARERLIGLLDALEGAEDVYIITHDNPDPDALASAAALGFLVHERVGPSPTLAFGGIVGRAENRALLAEMEVEFERMEEIEIPSGATIAMVDTQPRAGNNSLPAGRIVSAVIDHHPPRSDTAASQFVDLRPGHGSSGSMLVEYLRAAGLEPERWLATALFYAIQSETMDLGREASAADVEASTFLYPRSDPAAISRIRHARVPATYFRALHEAIATARRHGRVIAVPLGNLAYPDMVAEVADLFLLMQGVDWTVAMGRYRDRLLLSLRSQEATAHAGSLVRATIGDRGSAGGHGKFAGGQIDVRGRPEAEIEELRASIMEDLLRALEVDPAAGERLIPEPGGETVPPSAGDAA